MVVLWELLNRQSPCDDLRSTITPRTPGLDLAKEESVSTLGNAYLHDNEHKSPTAPHPFRRTV